MKTKYVLFFATAFSFLAAGSCARDPKHITVNQSRNGDFQRIQEAIESVPSNNTEPKIVVPESKPLIMLSCRKPNACVITWDAGGDIHHSPTVSVFASTFVGRYLTIQNTHRPGSKAVALRVTGDTVSFSSCRFISYQDTLFDEKGRHRYTNCYIEGAVDFIFGNAASFFENCHLHSLSMGNWAITAQDRKSLRENTGFFFLGGKITGIRSCVLGRPWGLYSRVVFAYTHMSKVVLPQGWDDWDKAASHSKVYYGEYRCYGPGANRSERVGWSHSLTREGVSLFLSTLDVIDDKHWIKTKF
ncbi:hypothetical protein Nepgr_015735 [Nepenthes gracilis]|uniref:Pectinesterase n=1 Tax=Nepenthes gracilis TaxID=150966 RepID=A0AAD3SNA9_NEPGR|nr:hypothetical protein Nepgr_015735 [Nepenthes gracilis]